MAEHFNAPRCHHVHVNGLRCGSPAMRHSKRCYYHKQTTGYAPPLKSDLTNLEDGNAIQLAIAHLVRSIDLGGIDFRAAQLKIYLYRLAFRNLKNLRTEPCNFEDLTTVDPDLQDSPDISHINEPLSHDEELEMIEAGTLSTRPTQPTAPLPQVNDLSSRAQSRTGVPNSSHWRGGSDLAVDLNDRAPSNVSGSTPHWVGSTTTPGDSSVASSPLSSHRPQGERSETKSPQDATYLADHVSGGKADQNGFLPSAEQDKRSAAAANHQRDAVAQPSADLGKRETGNGKPLANEKPETRNEQPDLNGKRETGNGKPLANEKPETRNEQPVLSGKRETGNGERFSDFSIPIDQLTEAEREARIMKLCKNEAYFMKEEDMPKAPPTPDFDDIMSKIRKELAAG